MTYSFQVRAIQEKELSQLFKLSDIELSRMGARRQIADAHPGYPCRMSLEDAEIGEELILLPFKHHNVSSPYQAFGPIYIRKNVSPANLEPNKLPPILKHRRLSLRAYDAHAMMQEASTIEGENLEAEIQRILAFPEIVYIQVHNASPGCYNCQIDRA